MATLRKMPTQAVPLVDPKTGLITPEWFLYLRSRENIGLEHLADVSVVAPTDGQALIYVDSNKKWEPGTN